MKIRHNTLTYKKYVNHYEDTRIGSARAAPSPGPPAPASGLSPSRSDLDPADGHGSALTSWTAGVFHGAGNHPGPAATRRDPETVTMSVEPWATAFDLLCTTYMLPPSRHIPTRRVSSISAPAAPPTARGPRVRPPLPPPLNGLESLVAT